MPLLSEMTDQQFVNLMQGYFAEPRKRSKLSQAQIQEIAEKLNPLVDVPFIKETREEQILIKLITRVDTYLYEHLPNEFYDVFMSSEGGISREEARKIIHNLSHYVNGKINIPYIPEAAEYVIFRFVIAIVVNAAREKLNYTLVLAGLAEKDIPDTGELDAADLLLEEPGTGS